MSRSSYCNCLNTKYIEDMKQTFKTIRSLAPAIVLPFMLVFQSCLKDKWDGYYESLDRANAIVTVKPLEDGGFYMQLDEQTTVYPVNMDTSPYEEKTRAFANLRMVQFPSDASSEAGIYDAAADVNWFRDILNKDMVQVPGTVTDLDGEYGKDPVDIMASWMTSVEDGYFTIHFETYSRGIGATHEVNLIQPDPDKPYELEFRHNANGDTYGTRVWGIAAFDLSAFEFREGEEVTFTLRWNSFGKERTHEFRYVPGKAFSDAAAGVGQELPGDGRDAYGMLDLR